MRLRPAVLALALALPAAAGPCLAQGEASSGLRLVSEDLRIEQLADGGYHLYVRAKDGLGSILLTESTSDPSGKADNFAYRALEPSAVTAGEARILDGKKLPIEADSYFLVDSTPERDPSFGRAYHVFIPWVVAWGYAWSRSGRVFIHDGTFINIRAFAKPFADYSGAFADNPYLVRVTQASPAKPAVAAPKPVAAAPVKATAAPSPRRELYIPETLDAYSALAKATGGELRYAASDKDIASQVDALLEGERGKALDLVLCVDSTDSMIGGVAELRSRLPTLLAKRLPEFPSLRLGLIAYKDYFEEYLYKRLDLTDELGTFSAELASIECGGGRDIPEAVYEALYAAIDEYPWSATSRLIVLVGDAPPHPLPRGSIAASDVEETARAAGIRISCVAVPK